MSIEDDIAFLERVPALNVLGHEALRIIAIGSESLYVHTGSALFREGEAADSAYVVQDGALTAASARNSEDANPTVIGPGALLGELALITETRRPLTVTALEPSSVLRIPRTLFLKMLEGYPDAAARMREHLARRAEDLSRDIRAVRSALDPKGA